MGLGLDGVDATWEVQDSSLVLSLILRGQDWRCSIRTAKIQLALRLRFWGIKLLSIMIYLGPWMSEFADKNICLYVIFKNLHLWLTFVCFYVIFLGNDLSCFFFFLAVESISFKSKHLNETSRYQQSLIFCLYSFAPGICRQQFESDCIKI